VSAQQEISAADVLPYVGSWSNGRGEILTITKTTLQFGDDRPVLYRDVTRVTDGTTYFELLITTSGKNSAFDAKTLGAALEKDSMTITWLSDARRFHGRQECAIFGDLVQR